MGSQAAGEHDSFVRKSEFQTRIAREAISGITAFRQDRHLSPREKRRPVQRHLGRKCKVHKTSPCRLWSAGWGKGGRSGGAGLVADCLLSVA